MKFSFLALLVLYPGRKMAMEVGLKVEEEKRNKRKKRIKNRAF